MFHLAFSTGEEHVSAAFHSIARAQSRGFEPRRPQLKDGSNAIVENGWSRIKTLEEAEAVAKAAREGKGDPREDLPF
jgi:hypothetical protein